MDKLVINAGIKIKNAREKKGLSTRKLAKLAKVSATQINMIENAKRDALKLCLLYRLSFALDIPVYEIISCDINSIIDVLKLDYDNINQKKFALILSKLSEFTNKVNNDNIKMDMLYEKILLEIDYAFKII